MSEEKSHRRERSRREQDRRAETQSSGRARAESELVERVAKAVLEQIGEHATIEPTNETRERMKTYVRNPRNPEALARLVNSTPARLGVGRSGLRYLTPVYLRFRADHAIAKEAVYSEVPDTFAPSMQCVPLRSRANDRETYLLRPSLGRALDDASKSALSQLSSSGCDVQIILGDGLSAWALTLNAPALVPALEREIAARGFSTGKRLFVRFSRIAVADEIGVAVKARSTVILVGERPGLGTGDSLSAYIAYAPRVGQPNAEKNCVSNIRPAGLSPESGAREIADILARAFAAGRGGVEIASTDAATERGGDSRSVGERTPASQRAVKGERS